MELVTGFEPTTRGLRYRCSAVEPHQHIYKIILLFYLNFFNKKVLYFADDAKTIENHKKFSEVQVYMQSVKTFLITFLSSVCIVLFSFGVLYWSAAAADRYTAANENDIPIAVADSSDNKTTLVFAATEENPVFLLIKLNAVDKKVSVTAIPTGFSTASGRTLAESFEYAGIMQCVEDLSAQTDFTIDYHIVLNSDDIENLSSTFADINLPDIISSGNPEYIAQAAAAVIKNNIANIQNYTLADIPKEFSYLSTNIGKTEAAKLGRILTLLQRSQAEYTFSVTAHSDE